MQISRTFHALAMDLFTKAIQCADGLAVFKKLIRKTRADKPSASRNQNTFPHLHLHSLSESLA